MFGINNEKLINKLRTEVIPDLMNQNVEDIVKYNLALKYLIDMSDFKQIGCLTGVLLTSVGFFAFTNPIVIGACATGAIASGVEWYKSFKDTKNYSRYFRMLIIGMEVFHGQTPDKVGAILKDITAEDLVDFLEKEGVTNE